MYTSDVYIPDVALFWVLKKEKKREIEGVRKYKQWREEEHKPKK